MRTASRLLDAIDPVRIFERNGLTPDPWQEAILRRRPQQALICWGRQAGKSLTFGALACWWALYRPGSQVLLASFNQNKAKDLLAKATELWKPFEEKFPLESSSTEHAEWKNGSTILALPAKPDAARGPRANVVILDEAAWTTAELKAVITQTLATTNGPLYAISTPPPEPIGWWWSAWTKGGTLDAKAAVEEAGDRWIRSLVPSTECPRISADFFERVREDDGPSVFARECLCEFPEMGQFTSNTPISPHLVDAVQTVGADSFFGR